MLKGFVERNEAELPESNIVQVNVPVNRHRTVYKLFVLKVPEETVSFISLSWTCLKNK